MSDESTADRTPRAVVITGASQGLGLASATLLYQRGWRVVAAMRSMEAGLERLRAATGARDGDPRLVPVRLDLEDEESVAAATAAIVGEVSPFGLGVTVLVTGTFGTEIITDAVPDFRDFNGPYARQNRAINRRGRAAVRHAAPPERFARGLARALDGRAPFARVPVGTDARVMLLASRLLPARALHQVTRLAMGLPGHGTIPGPPASPPVPSTKENTLNG